MAQFDVFRLSDSSLVLDCQSDLINAYETRFVVPLIVAEADAVIIPRLHPRFRIEETDVVMVTQFAGTISRRELMTRIGSLEHERLRIISAIDVLTGSG
ncbi:MAG: hypothetical protein B7Y43_13260 [Sphingomonas sp. 28-62-20]|uniref:CcdB family protein n=1 Tax=Sphingomonas sp. 28-62-20 TaxID=1970433 RepID=UPI000BDC746F|nr:MAG: hypothetical protein B7Y43_13260 [Sphingomonas sp. 28-62-20]